MKKTGGWTISTSLLVGSLVLVIVIAVYVFIAAWRQDTPEKAAHRFLLALAKKDLDTLMELSYWEGSPEDLRQQWDFCVNKAAKHYVFMWRLLSTRKVSEDRAAVRVSILEFRASRAQGAYGTELQPGGMEMPLVRVDGRWKVDLMSLTRRFFPFLPR
jgi:hypothetical protein